MRAFLAVIWVIVCLLAWLLYLANVNPDVTIYTAFLAIFSVSAIIWVGVFLIIEWRNVE